MRLEASNVRIYHVDAAFPCHLGKVRPLSVGGLLRLVLFVFVSIWTFEVSSGVRASCSGLARP